MLRQDEIKVSVCVVTYNQEKYIAECLQSLVDQETAFPFEIIVGDDCSTDKTRNIVDGFAEKYPNLILRNYHSENLGPTRNLFSTYLKARGDYICHIDGDDLALANKISSQADILDRFEQCVMVVHSVNYIDSNGVNLERKIKVVPKGLYNREDLIENLPFFSNSSKMFRNTFNKDFYSSLLPECYDFELHLAQAKSGLIYNIDETLGCYRIDVGVAGGSRYLNKSLIEAKRRVFEDLLKEYSDTPIFPRVKRSYSRQLYLYAKWALRVGDFNEFKFLIRESTEMSRYDLLQATLLLFSFVPDPVAERAICALRKMNS